MATGLAQSNVTLDVSDVQPRVGQLIGGGQHWVPCSATDIRRWVQAMDYANPIHWDEQFARQSQFGGIVAPQSFTVSMDFYHGVHPACVGRIPGSHLIFGGEEWWFYGTRIRPGDQHFCERRSRLQGDRDEIRGADHVLAGRYDSSQPDRSPRGQGAFNCHSLSCGRSGAPGHVRQSTGRGAQVDAGGIAAD